VATSAFARPSGTRAAGEVGVLGAYALGAVLLAGEAAVHIQQYASFMHEIRWIGALFLANAAASIATIAGLAYPRTRQLAAFAGVAISVVALASLVISYGNGLFGWQEVGWRTAVALTVICEAGAVIVLSAALGSAAALRLGR
jgi:hypothetical protein